MKLSYLRTDEKPTTTPLNLLWQLVDYKRTKQLSEYQQLTKLQQRSSFSMPQNCPYFVIEHIRRDAIHRFSILYPTVAKNKMYA